MFMLRVKQTPYIVATYLDPGYDKREKNRELSWPPRFHRSPKALVSHAEGKCRTEGRGLCKEVRQNQIDQCRD